MAKGKATDISDLLTPEQNVEESGVGMPDLYFLMVPRHTLEVLNAEAKKRGLTLAVALGQAVENWLKEDTDGSI